MVSLNGDQSSTNEKLGLNSLEAYTTLLLSPTAGSPAELRHTSPDQVRRFNSGHHRILQITPSPSKRDHDKPAAPTRDVAWLLGLAAGFSEAACKLWQSLVHNSGCGCVSCGKGKLHAGRGCAEALQGTRGALKRKHLPWMSHKEEWSRKAPRPCKAKRRNQSTNALRYLCNEGWTRKARKPCTNREK
eukprot:132467-Pelagomonas_calceolata.AAC.4